MRSGSTRLLPSSCLAVALFIDVTGCQRIEDQLLCSTEIQNEASSAGNLHTATVFHRECGATSGFNTQVSLRRSDQGFNAKAGQVLAIDGRATITCDWLGDHKLVVEMPDEQIYNQIRSWDGVEVEYKIAKP